jgi:hypothetical protein
MGSRSRRADAMIHSCVIPRSRCGPISLGIPMSCTARPAARRRPQPTHRLRCFYRCRGGGPESSPDARQPCMGVPVAFSKLNPGKPRTVQVTRTPPGPRWSMGLPHVPPWQGWMERVVAEIDDRGEEGGDDGTAVGHPCRWVAERDPTSVEGDQLYGRDRDRGRRDRGGWRCRAGCDEKRTQGDMGNERESGALLPSHAAARAIVAHQRGKRFPSSIGSLGLDVRHPQARTLPNDRSNQRRAQFG